MTLREVIKSLMAKSTRTEWTDGTEYTFAGNVDRRIIEAIKDAYRRYELDASGEQVYTASKGGCHVSFRLGRGASTQTFVKFSFTDERALAVA